MRGWAVIAAVAVAMLGLVASFEVGLLPSGSSTTCTSCLQSPIVDLVMPSLGNSGNLTNPNRVVNMTQGESRTLEVDVYPTAGLSVNMSFRSVLVSAAGGQTSLGEPGIAATFNPPTLTVGSNQKGPTFLTLTIPAGAARGTYDAVVSATDQSNSSEVWGLYFEIVVS